MTSAFAALSADTPLRPHQITRRDPGPTDVAIEILFCGVCHSDLHTARGEWSGSIYPCVPGHEIVGRVTAVGDKVAEYHAGDLVAVGCLVDSCRACPSCKADMEQYCTGGATWTYNSLDKHLGTVTYGGYSAAIVVDEAFVLRLPSPLDPAAAAPLLCAGITTWSPMRHWNVGTASHVGIVGLGGLGHMGVKLAHALGARVTVFTRSPGKTKDAERLGASDVVVTDDAGSWIKQRGWGAGRGPLNLIIDTVALSHNLDPYLDSLAPNGMHVLVGLPETPNPPPSERKLLGKRHGLAGSSVGGLKETQDMLDFCAEHKIVSDIEMITMAEINEAYERMLRSDVRYRFVIDMKTIDEKR